MIFLRQAGPRWCTRRILTVQEVLDAGGSDVREVSVCAQLLTHLARAVPAERRETRDVAASVEASPRRRARVCVVGEGGAVDQGLIFENEISF